MPHPSPACRSALPRCSFEAIASSGNYGFWMDFEWFPFACQLAPMSLDEAFRCLEGKRVMLLGESQGGRGGGEGASGLPCTMMLAWTMAHILVFTMTHPSCRMECRPTLLPER